MASKASLLTLIRRIHESSNNRIDPSTAEEIQAICDMPPRLTSMTGEWYAYQHRPFFQKALLHLTKARGAHYMKK